MHACSLKFCTAIDRPAPIRLAPRCCRSAFIGTTRKPPIAPSRIRNGAASQTSVMTLRPTTRIPMTMPYGMTLRRLVEPHAQRGDDRAGGGADGDHADERRGLRRRVAERRRRPGEDDHAQVARDAPEQRRRRQRDLAELVVPQARIAVREVAHQHADAARQRLQRRFGARDAQVEERGDDVERDDDRDRRLGRRADAGVEHRHVEGEQVLRDDAAEQLAAEQDAEDDRQDRQALDPAVRLDQLRVRQQLGEDAVLGRRVRRRAEADDARTRAAGWRRTASAGSRRP